jgi:hypothetical protein
VLTYSAPLYSVRVSEPTQWEMLGLELSHSCALLDCSAIESDSLVFRPCAGCAEAKYCSRQCQRDHWEVGVTPRHIISLHITSRRVTSCHVTSCHVILFRCSATSSCHVTLPRHPATSPCHGVLLRHPLTPSVSTFCCVT